MFPIKVLTNHTITLLQCVINLQNIALLRDSVLKQHNDENTNYNVYIGKLYLSKKNMCPNCALFFYDIFLFKYL